LPKVVIAIVLVTFSYAIAGFLIDLMYVFIGIISVIFTQVVNLPLVKSNLIFGLLTKGFFNTGIFGFLLFYIILFWLALVAAIFGGTGGAVGFLATQFTTLGLFMPLLLIFSIIISIIVGILLMFIAIKIVFMLVKAFATILLLVIFAPLQIAIGTLVPNLGFGSWLKSIVANLAVFPITGVLFMLSYVFLIRVFYQVIGVFLSPQTTSDILGQLVSPTGLQYIFWNEGWPPLLGVGDRMISTIFLAVSLMILFLIPKVSDMIKGMIEGKPFAYGTAIGQAFGPIGAAWGSGPVSSARRELNQEIALRTFAGIESRLKGTGLQDLGEFFGRIGRQKRVT
jgi:hypothetical protein